MRLLHKITQWVTGICLIDGGGPVGPASYDNDPSLDYPSLNDPSPDDPLFLSNNAMVVSLACSYISARSNKDRE